MNEIVYIIWVVAVLGVLQALATYRLWRLTRTVTNVIEGRIPPLVRIAEITLSEEGSRRVASAVMGHPITLNADQLDRALQGVVHTLARDTARQRIAWEEPYLINFFQRIEDTLNELRAINTGLQVSRAVGTTPDPRPPRAATDPGGRAKGGRAEIIEAWGAGSGGKAVYIDSFGDPKCDHKGLHWVGDQAQACPKCGMYRRYAAPARPKEGAK